MVALTADEMIEWSRHGSRVAMFVIGTSSTGIGIALDGVMQRHAVPGQRRRVEQRRRRVDDLLQLVDQNAFVIRLQHLESDAALLGQAMQPLIDFGQGRGAVDVRLATAEQVQVGTVEDEEFHGSADGFFRFPREQGGWIALFEPVSSAGESSL
jgi:hypothetical protein